MNKNIVSLLATALLWTGCAVEPEIEVVQREDQCDADKSEFENYYAATACEKADPVVFSTALGALVKAGATCTAEQRDGNCSSIEPIKDDQTEKASWWPISCHNDHDCGIVNCQFWVECCVVIPELGTRCFDSTSVYVPVPK